MEFIDRSEQRRTTSALVYSPDAPQNTQVRASAYVRNDQRPEFLEVESNLPEPLNAVDRAALSQFVADCVDHGNWEGITDAVVMPLSIRRNARLGIKGVLDGSGEQNNPDHVKEGWKCENVGPKGIWANRTCFDLFGSIPTNDVFFHHFLYESLNHVDWNGGFGNLGSPGNMGTRASATTVTVAIQSGSVLQWWGGNYTASAAQKSMFGGRRQPSNGRSMFLWNGVDYGNEGNFAWDEFWRNAGGVGITSYSWQDIVGGVSTQADATWSFLVWGQHSKVDHVILYNDILRMLRMFDIDV